MTTVKARFGRDGYSVKATGHAGTSDSCVAVSAIVQALAGWVHNGTGGMVSLDKGEAIIAFPDCPGAGAVMEMTVIGLLQIQKAAPDDVKVDICCED